MTGKLTGKDLTPFQEDILLKLREHLVQEFASWKKAADEGRERNNPLNDTCIQGMEKNILSIFKEYNVLGALQLVCSIEEKAENIFARWTKDAERARGENQPFNDQIIAAIQEEIIAVFAESDSP